MFEKIAGQAFMSRARDVFTFPIVLDPRVSPVLTHCLTCHAALPAPTTAGAGSQMVLFAQCQTPTCQRVYMLDYADFGA